MHNGGSQVWSKLFLEFDGSTSVVDWIERVELTCCLCRVKLVIPLWLMGGALEVYQQLSDNEKADIGLTKVSLYKAFMMDPCTAYEHFTTQTLMAGETVGVFVALKKLAVLFGGLSEWTFVYAFMAWLPAWMKQPLRASTSIEATLIELLLECTWATIRDKAELGELVVMAEWIPSIVDGLVTSLRMA